jgi:hypothetical protein
MNVCELTLAISHPHRSRTGTTGWGAWRMLRCVRERSRLSSPSELWVARPLSPYNVIIYLFCTELLLYSKDVTFDLVPWFIICVRLGPSTPGDYVRAGSWCPETRVWHLHHARIHILGTRQVAESIVSRKRLVVLDAFGSPSTTKRQGICWALNLAHGWSDSPALWIGRSPPRTVHN